VLEARAGTSFGPFDVYLNVAGGLRINEPAADLAVAAALLSARLDAPLPRGTAYFGEIGLSGTVRPVNLAEARLKEAAKLGFLSAVTPRLPNGAKDSATGMKTVAVPDVAALLDAVRRA